MIPISKPYIKEEEINAVVDVLKSGMLACGKKTQELEQGFAKLCHRQYGVATNNGTTALHSALHAIGVKKSHEVITTPFTFFASASCVEMIGAKVVFADIDYKTFNIDPASIKERITEKTKAIVAVDIFGQPYAYDEIKKIAEDNGLYLVEDAAQAVNAEYKGKKAGSLGDISTFSLYATKNITAGEGGMVVFDKKDYFEKTMRYRHHGQSALTHGEHIELGYNYRLTDIQAALGVEQLKRVDFLTNMRRENAAYLSEHLKNIKGIELPYADSYVKHVFHQYVLRIKDIGMTRDALCDHFRKNDVFASIHYPMPLHLNKIYRKKGYKEGDFPVAEQACKEVLSLPVHPSLTKDELNKIIKVLEEL
jgi:perosamine synthetase